MTATPTFTSRVVISKEKLDSWRASATRSRHLSEDPVSFEGRLYERLQSDLTFSVTLIIVKMVQHTYQLSYLREVRRSSSRPRSSL